MAKMKKWEWVLFALVTVGAVNWGLDAFGWSIFQLTPSWLATTIKLAVAGSGIFGLYAVLTK